MFLFRLYIVTPKFLKGLFQKYIIQMEGGQMYSKTLRTIYKNLYRIEVGYGTYGGCFSRRNIPAGVKFGNYCSIAPEIRIFRANHPKDTFTSHPLLYNPSAGFVKKDMLTRPTLTIGNDVWIGEWAIILPSVNYIGNGAIIGAGSIVTKDVEPYSIVAGNPAKPIGTRFTKDVVNELEKTGWWYLEKETLMKEIDRLQGIINPNTL